MDIKALVDRLAPESRSALEAASGLTLSRTHYDVEIEHWLLKLIESGDSAIGRILSHYEVDGGRVAADLAATLDRLRTGNARAPALSPRLVRWMREAWLFASLGVGAGSVAPAHLLASLMNDDMLASAIRESSSALRRIDARTLTENFAIIAAPAATADAPADQPANPGGGGTASTAALDKYCIDLTDRARSGGIDPVLGRDPEIRQLIDILTRRRQNNPILTGEAGVGKTAVVEGFALRIAAGEVPDVLKQVRLLSLDLGLLQAGAGVKGEFENRLKSVISEVKASPTPIVMFIDEAHTLIGAGGAEGQGDAANLLKPALARGEMRTIAATTWAEYKKYFEKDAALTRRFQVVKVEEPNEADAIKMVRGLVATLEKHHNIRILDEAVDAAVRLSHRYIFGRQLPDKAIALLDTACARVGMSQASTPASIEATDRQLAALDIEAGILERETAGGYDHTARQQDIVTEREAVAAKRVDLVARWEAERQLVDDIAAFRRDAEGPAEDASEAAATSPDTITQLRAARAELAALQGETPLVLDVVDRVAVADVVAGWTGIPVGRMVADEIAGIIDFEAIMAQRIRGQPQALAAIGSAMRANRAGLTDPNKPVGVFLMVGLSGVGKTETAMALADRFYGGADNMTVINMSEFKEEHKVSMLLGAPPGYVGYGEGGVLTEAVRRRPFSVILLDEMEKAHPGVQDVFYQLFDKGRVKDGQGRDVDFRNAMIIMTSNAGWEAIEPLCADPDIPPSVEALEQALRPKLLDHFRPAFLGRVTVVPYLPLPPAIIREIIGLALGKIARRLTAAYGATFTWSDAVVDLIAARSTESQSGARAIDGVVNRGLLPELSTLILNRLQSATNVAFVRTDVDDRGNFLYRFDDQ
ncbi:type VI secretion system ATPase TssH [Glacieibacterium megasporae]|uniref:type VI secretion system ATPase TssH n=1 Tax=Glacieibacterium megasporae TaxID=2835787 RepID=UPI001C1DDF23|nr:type VI secretion system ATPase TssH [Polymorphobacter megasporae]UAJ11315.1 type VI secretion system ATPase TssH [Polymorphobacter megasporae]